ncbi:MAG: DUF3794 domain-containing protein [Oscillospiraceae bacterium]|nr:DUF3794 domain-containing protein [Oscillospiraceae bacterium]
MELQFEKTGLDCMTTLMAMTRGEEQTQEVRLPDNMSDVGRVLGTWGQVLLRGKEWRSAGMGVSLGVMAWVLYAPEEGGAPQVVETWIPFQLKWEFPETKRDGRILASCLLSGIDARSISARKLVVRASVSVMGEALEPDSADMWVPGTVPEDVHLLKRNYPVLLPREAGEKQFELEEELTLPGSAGTLSRIVCCSLWPEVIDQKVMAGKVVFRGTGQFHLLFLDPDGNLKTWDQELSFSQFADLEQDYDSEAQARVIPAVTGLEADILEPDRLGLKIGMVGQYVVSDRQMLELVEDAYSTRRTVTPQVRELQLPAVLDDRFQTLRLTQEPEIPAERILDTCLLLSQPRIRREEDTMLLEQSGSFQVLYSDENGELKGKTVPAEATASLPADSSSRIMVTAVPTGTAQGSVAGDRMNLRGEALVRTVTTGDQGIPMVTGLELGEMTQPDPGRPSMILRRMGSQRLWDVAKASGSTVEDICRANNLQGEPDPDRMLLIPVP